MKPEYALSFAAWELRLYLDTHPDDERAFTAYKQLCAAQGGGCNYACHTADPKAGHGNTAPLCGCAPAVNGKKSGRVWHWIDSPWPWEYEAGQNGGKC